MVPGVKVGILNDTPGLETLVDDKTCGVIVEPIQGEGGVYEASEEFLTALRERCNKVGAVLIYDEIQVCRLFFRVDKSAVSLERESYGPITSFLHLSLPTSLRWPNLSRTDFQSVQSWFPVRLPARLKWVIMVLSHKYLFSNCRHYVRREPPCLKDCASCLPTVILGQDACPGQFNGRGIPVQSEKIPRHVSSAS